MTIRFINIQQVIFCLMLVATLMHITACSSPNSANTLQQKDSIMITRLVQTGNKIVWRNQDSAQLLIRRALALSNKKNYQYGATMSLVALGVIYSTKGDFDSSKYCFEEALKHTLQSPHPDSSALLTIYNNLAANQIQFNNYKEALNLLLKTADIATEQKLYKVLTHIYNNIGSILIDMDDNDRALYYLDKGIDAAFKMKEPDEYLVPLYTNQCEVLMRKHQYERVKEKCRLILNILEKYPDEEAEAFVYSLLGRYYDKSGNKEKAIASYKSVLDIKGELPASKHRAALLLGDMYLEKKQYQLAESSYNYTLSLAEKINSPLLWSESYKGLSDLNKMMGNNTQALAYMEQYIKLKDSVQSLEKMKAVTTMEARFRFAEKDKEIAENKLLIAQQRTRIINRNILLGGVGLGVLLLLLGGWFFYKNYRRNEKQQREIAIYQALTEGEEKERGRIARELHDGIGGLLTTLKMQHDMMGQYVPAVKQTHIYTESEALLDSTILEIRKTAHNLMPELLLRHGLVEAVNIFCRSMQEGNELKIEFQCYGLIEDMDAPFHLAVYRIIQELVHNVLKHAHATEVFVQLSRHNEILDITVEDNGVGFIVGQQVGGMGLKSIASRVKELKGTLNVRSNLSEGTAVNIEFNISKNLKENT